MKNEKGTIIVGVIIIMTIIMGLGASLIFMAINLSVTTQKSYKRISAMSLAEAGIEKTMWELNSGQQPSCISVCDLSGGQFKVTVTNIDSETKEIESVGFIPSMSDPKTSKTVKVNVSAKPDTEGIAFSYAIQSGTGGIDVSGSSEVDGNLFSNGNIVIANSNSVTVNGGATAVGTITDPKNRITGTKTQNYNPPQNMPSINIDMWKSLAESGGTISGDYSPPTSGSYTDFGPKEITGNFSMSSSSQKINLLGSLYIQGNLSISGGEWKLDDSFGSKGTVVLVDGTIDISGSTKFFGNSSGSYILFVSTNTADTSSDPAIKYSGSADGQKLSLYAPNGAIKIMGSGKVVAMTGKTLYIAGSGEIEYESGMASAEFAGGPGGSWIKKWWKEE